jgi:hypothetical protein
VLKALDGRLAKFEMPKRAIFDKTAAQRHGQGAEEYFLRDTYAGIYAK